MTLIVFLTSNLRILYCLCYGFCLFVCLVCFCTVLNVLFTDVLDVFLGFFDGENAEKACKTRQFLTLFETATHLKK